MMSSDVYCAISYQQITSLVKLFDHVTVPSFMIIGSGIQVMLTVCKAVVLVLLVGGMYEVYH
jgi:hypothetical protein